MLFDVKLNVVKINFDVNYRAINLDARNYGDMLLDIEN